MLRVLLEDMEKKRTQVTQICAFALSSAADAPCDGLRLTFYASEPVAEMQRVYVYTADKLLFSGFVDWQKASADKEGVRHFIYARSAACLLIDNEARPGTLYQPTSAQLFHAFAAPFGFSNALPRATVEAPYEIAKGTSCFGAIQDFMLAVQGKTVFVTPQGALSVLTPSAQAVSLNTYAVIEAQRQIRRGGLLSEYHYKTGMRDSYTHHMKSRFCEEAGVHKSRYLNLSALPPWQRDGSVRHRLTAPLQAYQTWALTLGGAVDLPLYTVCTYKNSVLGDFDGCLLQEKVILLDAKGLRTKCRLQRPIDAKEIAYVAQ